MKTKQIWTVTLLISILITPFEIFGQVSGNVAYENSYYKKSRSSSGTVYKYLSDSTMLVSAGVLMNVLADEYVAVFGVSEEGTTVAECNDKIGKRINNFISGIKKLGIGTKDFYVDFITQNRIYDFQLSGNTAYEKLVGFELKKNISIHFKDKKLIDKLTVTASKYEIFDLIKVDYIVSDIPKIKNRLFEEATKIIDVKKKMYIVQTHIKLLPESQIYTENFVSHYPSDLYDSYSAFESATVKSKYYSKTTTVQKRKMKTFYFKPIGQSVFDLVINPVIIEPVIQFSYTLEIKFEIDKK